MAIPYNRNLLPGVSWYSALIVMGILCAILLAEKEERRRKLPRDTIIDLTLWAIPAGIVGARLYYVLMSLDQFRANPVSVLYIWEGGIAIYGGILGGMLAVFLYARRKKLNFLTLADVLVPGVLLAQAIGRWGNYFNMECYGPEILSPTFQFFPVGVLIPDGTGGYMWHMATFFYESLWNLCGYCALWALRKRQTRPGNLFAWYLLIYGSGRFIIEQLRQDSLYVGSLRASQWLSLVFCVIAAGWLLWGCYGKKRRKLWLSLLSALLLTARWFLLNAPFWYGLVLLLGLAAGFASLAPLKGSGRFFWLLPLILDLTGLALCAAFPASFFLHLHTALCSVTLPLYLGWLSGPSFSSPSTHAKETEPCPPET